MTPKEQLEELVQKAWEWGYAVGSLEEGRYPKTKKEVAAIEIPRQNECHRRKERVQMLQEAILEAAHAEVTQ